MYKIFKGFVIAGLMIVPQQTLCQQEVFVEKHEVPAAKTYNRATIDAALLVVGGACLVALAYYIGTTICTDIATQETQMYKLGNKLLQKGVELDSIEVTTKLLPKIGTPFMGMFKSCDYVGPKGLAPADKNDIDALIYRLDYLEKLSPSYITTVIAQVVALSGLGSVMAYCGVNKYQHVDQQKSDQELAEERAAQESSELNPSVDMHNS